MDFVCYRPIESEVPVARSTVSVVAVLVLLVAAPPVVHGADPARACSKRKLGATAKKIADKLKCFATAAGKGVTVDAACLSKAEGKFASAFVKAEAKGGCPTVNDVATVESQVDDCVDAVRSALGTSAQKNACLKGKLSAAAKKASGKVQCSAKAASKGRFADPVCLAKAEAAFAKAFAKRDAKGGCVTTNDAASIETIVDDQCVSTIVAALPVPTITPTPTKTATPIATKTATPVATGTPIPTPTSNGCGENPPALWAQNVAEQNDVRVGAQPVPDPALAPYCWKATIAATAQSWADNCSFSHNPNLDTLGLGENIYGCASTDSSCPTNAPDQSVISWANEDVSYDYASNTCSVRCQGGSNAGATCSTNSQCPGGLCSGVCGHYTQLVWRSTSFTGCGVKTCNTGSPLPGFTTWTLVVCDYEPPGNFVGQRPY